MSGNVHRLPRPPTRPPAADPLAAAGITTMKQVDQMLRDAGVIGVLHGCEYAWQPDRPLLPNEARAVLARNAADPLADGPASADVVAAMGVQMAAQAASFRVAALALRSNRIDLLDGTGDQPGTFFADARKLLAIDTELEALTPTARHALAVSREQLAELLDRSGEACSAVVKEIAEYRFQYHALPAMQVIAAHDPEPGGREEAAHV